MANQRNYQKELEKLLENFQRENRVPTLFLHSCCAPCSSYVLEYLSSYFKITVFYYNPNIYPKEEYEKRVQELKKLVQELPARYPIPVSYTHLRTSRDPHRSLQYKGKWRKCGEKFHRSY